MTPKQKYDLIKFAIYVAGFVALMAIINFHL